MGEMAVRGEQQETLAVAVLSGHVFLVLRREWGEWVMGIIIGEYIGTTIGIHSPIPYQAPGPR